MDNSKETITEENVDIANDNITINEKLIHIAKKHTENIYSEAEWSIVYFETDIEKEIDDGFYDLIPSSWITRGTSCFYPMHENRAIICKLAKHCAKPDLKWNYFSIKKIEENIGKFYETRDNFLHIIFLLIFYS